MTRHIGLKEVMGDPREIASYLVASGDVYGLVEADVRVDTSEFVCMWLTLDPWVAMASEGFPREQVAITVFRYGAPAAVPVGAQSRSWAHRYPFRWGSIEHLGQLCLWYPDDPPSLKWSWSNGLVEYITIVHRHLMAEEYWRRNGRWPAEDSPHGEGVHPIRSAKLRELALGEVA